MKTSPAYSWRNWLSGYVVVTALLTAGCVDDGKDGATGPAGPAAPTAVVRSDTPERAFSTIETATVADDGTLTVEFTVKDSDANGYVGLKDSEIRLLAAQLNPGVSSGDSTAWHRVAYERSRGTFGTLTDNGDGSYSYSFATNIKSADGYNADRTYRIGLQLDGDLRPSNATFDMVPSGRAATEERKIVSETACNSCHGQLRMHGGRISTDYCVLCHNPDLTEASFDATDPDGDKDGDGNLIPNADFKVMVHKIHRGGNLPSVVAGGSYKFDDTHDYSEVALPQDIRNCDICHQESNTATPQASNWRTQPTMEACGSCHDDVNFADSTNHGAGQALTDNSSCVGCHGEGAPQAAELYHTTVMARKEALRDAVVVQPTAVRVDQINGDVEVDLTLTMEGELVQALHTGDPDVETTEGAKLGRYRNLENGALAINWDNGSGFQLTHIEVDLNDCTPVAGIFTCRTTDTGAGLFAGITDSDLLYITTVDLLVCFNEKDGTVIDCNQGGEAVVAQLEVTPAPAAFNGDGSEATSTYDKIGADIDSCQNCHGDKHYHHGASQLEQCKTCHNATRASSRGRPGDLKHHVHRAHSTMDRDPLDVDDVVDHFPNNIDNCTACHTEDQFDLPLQQNTRASRANRDDPVYISPTAVVCGSCHISTNLGYIDPGFSGYLDPADGQDAFSEAQLNVINHMVLNGAVFGGLTQEAATGKEACSVCHAIGREFAVDSVHTLIQVDTGSDQ